MPANGQAEAEAMAAKVLALCAEQGIHLATAESLTGGLLADTLVSVPGASKVFVGGVVAYANQAKEALAGVPANVLESCGAVSAETAIALAQGVRAQLATAGAALLGVSTTGVAGPETQDNQPVGTVFVGIATHSGSRAIGYRFEGDRFAIRSQAVAAALAAVAEELGC